MNDINEINAAPCDYLTTNINHKCDMQYTTFQNTMKCPNGKCANIYYICEYNNNNSDMSTN